MGAGQFTHTFGYKRPTVTIRSLVRRGLVQEIMLKQYDIEAKDVLAVSGWFRLTDGGEKWVVAR